MSGVVAGDSASKSFAMLHGADMTTELPVDMRPRCDSLPDQSTAAGSKRKSILKKEALNREEMEGLLSGSGGVGAGSSRNSFGTPLDGTPARAQDETAAENADDDDDDDDDHLVVRHLPRLSDSTDTPPRRVYPLYVSQLPTSQSVATIAEFDTDCEEESSMEGELDRRPTDSASGRPRTDSASSGPVSDHPREPPKYQHPAAGACGGDDGVPLDNVRSPQNANVPLSQATDINLNPPLPARVPPPIPVRLQAPLAAADNLGNHLPHRSERLDHDRDQPADTTAAFTHNLFPTLDFIDEFAD